MIVYPLAFHRHPAQKWRRKAVSSSQIEPAETPARRSDQCPRCGNLAAAPFVSVHQPGSGIAHHWKCKICEFDWSTIFRPLLV
jgi:formate dehydrogenase maturation protein FdhE